MELSREVKETKEEVKAFKQEIRQTVSMLSNTANASVKNETNNTLYIQEPSKSGAFMHSSTGNTSVKNETNFIFLDSDKAISQYFTEKKYK